MKDLKDVVVKLIEHKEFDGMSLKKIADYCGISHGLLYKITKDQAKATWDTCRKLAIACGIDLHVVASELSQEEAAKRRKGFVKRLNKRIDDNAKKQKKSLIKG